MKIKLIFLSILLLCFLPLFGMHTADFLDSAINIAASGTATNGSEFTSNELDVETPMQKRLRPGAIIITFTRAAGTASTVDFEFEVSYDRGATWASFEGVKIEVATNHVVVSGTTVRVHKEIYFYGVSFIRLHSIKNNDSTNGITACNAILSL